MDEKKERYWGHMNGNTKNPYDRIRDKYVLARIAKLKSSGAEPSQISNEIYREFGFKPTPELVKKVIKSYEVKGTQFLDSEKDMAELYKQAIMELLNESKENVKTMSKFRERLKEIMDLLTIDNILEDKEVRNKFRVYLKDIQNIIRTLDNSISTEKGILELIEKQKKEVKMSATSTESIMENLEELEEEGLIVINPKLKKRRKVENEVSI